MPKPLVLILLDGWGYAPQNPYNAITQAQTPVWDHLWHHCPHTFISCSGLDVGLPEGQMGNSEVGHMTIGAGRPILQDLVRINQAIATGEFNHNPALHTAIHHCKTNHSALHLMGLLSPGGVHSHEDHLFALLHFAKQEQLATVYVHAFLDGRDTPPRSALKSLQKCQSLCDQLGNVQIASISGRYYSMDRDKRWERTQTTLDLLLTGQTEYSFTSAKDALQAAYDRQETDEFVVPSQIVHQPIQPNDAIIFFNFRPDRARQLTSKLRQCLPNTPMVTFTQYDPTFTTTVAFPKPTLTHLLGDVIASNHLHQLRIAETEKYAHVTYFFNGGQERPFKNEARLLIPSPTVATYDLQPEMSAFEVTESLLQAILEGHYDFIVCNFANADMVGHTGNLSASIKAIEALDACLGKIQTALGFIAGEAIITADHGNAECLFDQNTGQPHTAHTMNLVPLVYVGPKRFSFREQSGTLADIAPTVLQLLSLKIPSEMTGNSLIRS